MESLDYQSESLRQHSESTSRLVDGGFNVRNALVLTIAITNSAVNPEYAEMVSPKKTRIILNELSHSCGRVLRRLDDELWSRQNSR